MLIYIMNLLGNIYVTSVSLVFLAGLALQFLVKPDEKRYFFVTEKLTPFVYLVFSVIASLAN
jgi:hypothetical protein